MKVSPFVVLGVVVLSLDDVHVHVCSVMTTMMVVVVFVVDDSVLV